MTLDVLLPLKFDYPFTYNVPKDINVKAGDFVLVPFQNKDIIGVVWGKGSPIKSSIKIKDIKKKFDFVSLSKETLIFLDRFSRYNLVDLGIALKLFIFKKAFKELSNKKKDTSTYEYSLKKNIKFDESQKKAIKILDNQLSFDKFSTVLLHGITGSGKTLIYFQKIKDFLEKGYQVLVLLPEIALTNQIKERFKEYFGNYPALWHSDISEKNKRLIWNGIANHKINLVLGARSSLFLPFKKLGLIIIDEEHDQSYKQEDQVIYNARDMAVLMASIKKISVILVSATPSIETYYNTVNKKFSYISLDKRYGDAQLPEVKFVDLKKNPPLKSKFISSSIIPELKNILDKGGDGLATLIGEGGLKLSGGEKQRLSIARALLRHPHLLIFDEATSSLDSLTEESITDTIRDLSKEREQITIMIAHRLSTIIHATRIYVLEKGKVIESGNHQSLLEEKGLYYAMWRQQIGERKGN